MPQYEAYQPSSTSSELCKHHVHCMSYAGYVDDGPPLYLRGHRHLPPLCTSVIWKTVKILKKYQILRFFGGGCCCLGFFKQKYSIKQHWPGSKPFPSFSLCSSTNRISMYFVAVVPKSLVCSDPQPPLRRLLQLKDDFSSGRCVCCSLQIDGKWMGWLKTKVNKGLLENNKRIFRNSENLILLRVQIQTNQPEEAQTQHVTWVTDVWSTHGAKELLSSGWCWKQLRTA